MVIISKTPEEKYKYGDYLKWPEEERWEIINGIPYLMSPAPSRGHQRISIKLSYQFEDYLKDKSCEVYVSPFDVRLPVGEEKDEEIETVVQPDIVVVCDLDKLDDRGCKGAPDIIVEILSPATAKKDLNEKFNLYEQVGVREYWVVFPLEKVVDVYQLNANNKYEKSGSYFHTDKVKTGVIDGLEIDLSLVFERTD